MRSGFPFLSNRICNCISSSIFLAAIALATSFLPVTADDWIQTPGPGPVGVHALIQSGATTYAGTDVRGVYRSSNLGLNWTAANAGIDELKILSLVEGSGGLYAGTEWETNSIGGVYRSTNGGTSWTPATNGIENQSVFCLLADGTVLYAGTSSGLVFRSTDQGASWTSVSDGLFGASVYGLVKSNGVFYAACSQGLFQSDDEAASWAPVPGFEFYNLFSLARSGSLLLSGGFNGVLRSTNGGTSWSHVEISSSDFFHLSSFAFIGGTIYGSASGFSGSDVYRSTDQGLNWTPLGGEVAGAALDVLLANGTTLLGGGPEKGVLATTDGGLDWNRRTNGLPPGGSIRALLVDGTDLFAGTAGNGVWKSSDHGDTWIETNASDNGALANELIKGLAARNGTLFAGTGRNGVYRSTNRGASWTRVNTGFPNPRPFVLSLVTAGPNVIVGTDAGIYRSTNDGASWELRTPANFSTEDLAFSDGFAYAIVSSGFFMTTGIYRSGNNGTDWTLVLQAGSSTLICIAAEGLWVYSGDLLEGMFRSADHGTGWSFVNPVPENGIFSLLPHGAEVFAGSTPASDGAYRSTNHGASWTSWSEGLPENASIEHLASDAFFVFAGTDRAAVWRRMLPGVTDVADAGSRFDFRLSALPNPLGDQGMIRYRLASDSRVRLDLLDASGRNLHGLVDAQRSAGDQEERLDLGGLPQGVYFVRLAAGREIRDLKVVRVR